MKIRKILLIPFILMLITATSVYAYVTDFSFANLGKITEGNRKDESILLTVNDEPIYYYSLKTRYVMFETLKTEQMLYLEEEIDKETNKNTSDFYESMMDEIINKDFNTVQTVDEIIMERLILQDASMLNIKVSEDEIRERIISDNKALDDLVSQGNEDAIKTKNYINEYNSGLNLTDDEIADLQFSALLKVEIRKNHRILVIENKFGQNAYDTANSDQTSYYSDYCKKLYEDAEIIAVINYKDLKTSDLIEMQ